MLAEQSGLLLRPGVVVFRVPLALVIEHLLDEIELTLCRFQYLSSELHNTSSGNGPVPPQMHTHACGEWRKVANAYLRLVRPLDALLAKVPDLIVLRVVGAHLGHPPVLLIPVSADRIADQRPVVPV